MPALPLKPSILSPKVTSSLAKTEVLADGLKKFTPADLAPHILRVILEMKGAAARDQGGLAVARQIPPQAADDERLHGGAGPNRHARADAQAKPAPHVGVFVEGDLVAAKRKAVQVAPQHPNKRLDKGAATEAAEAITRIGAHAEAGGVEGVRKAGDLLLVVEEVGLEQRIDEKPALEMGGVGAGLDARHVELPIEGVEVDIGVLPAAE
jgi:hypothetical protein